MEKSRKRVKTALIFFVVPMAALAGRLFFIQVMCHDDFSEAATAQYEMVVEGIDTRGQIFDRNMNPVTGGSCQYYYIIKKERMTDEGSELLAATGASKLTSDDSRYLVYRSEMYSEGISERLKSDFNAYVFCSTSRYSDVQPACHLVGYLNQSEKRGVSGLEYMFEERLKAGRNRLVLTADAAGNILPGRAPYIRSEESTAPEDNSVVTSIELGLQKRCEELMAEACGNSSVSDGSRHGIQSDSDLGSENDPGSGACIVADAASGEILAMASVPTFNPNRIAECLQSDGDCLINKALQAAYPPGSVFKLVVAAAALENGLCTADRLYECSGETEVEGVTVSCSTAPEGGHGMINMYDAMAHSCNCYFAQLGRDIGRNAILDMASQLGLGSEVLDDYPEESSGFVPDASETDRQEISNISIGQGRLLTTPLQISRLTAIIAGGGASRPIHVLAGRSGLSSSETISPAASATMSAASSNEEQAASATPSAVSMHEEPAASVVPAPPASSPADPGGANDITNSAFTALTDEISRQYISRQTAQTLQTMMRGVMTDGTASSKAWELPVWGKSGTAEASRGGRAVKDCWFIGFCDIAMPETEAYGADRTRRFVITVFVEDGVSGSATALPVFRKITEYLSAHVEDYI